MPTKRAARRLGRRLFERRLADVLDVLEIRIVADDDQRGVDEIAGLRGRSNSFASRTLYGIVIAGMKPLISSCLMVASLWSGVTDRIWPCSVNSRGPAASPHAAGGRRSAAGPGTHDKEVLQRIG